MIYMYQQATDCHCGLSGVAAGLGAPFLNEQHVNHAIINKFFWVEKIKRIPWPSVYSHLCGVSRNVTYVRSISMLILKTT